MKPVGRQNQGSMVLDPLKDVYTAVLAEVIETRRVPLEARELIPQITNLDGLDVSSRIVAWSEYNYTGKSIVTDLKPRTVPVLVADSVAKHAPLKYLSFGIETSANDKQEIMDGKVKPVNMTEKAFRVVAEDENNFLLNGFTALGIKGINGIVTGDGIHIVAAGKTWATSTGEEILEDIRKMKVAMVTGKKFNAKTLALPQELDLLLDKQYSYSSGGNTVVAKETVRNILMERKYFDTVKSVVGISSPLGLDDVSNNMGFVQVEPLQVADTYTEGRSEISVIEEKISPFILFQPESVVKLTGAI
ncbi:MAG: major capsid family protein [Bacteroidales bacterium]|uniref:major capsid family protein n=1 Tax=Cetobacterium sp. TaxID=2071632 RepID=UPI003EE68366